jgi:hypothetical protein
MVVVRIVHPDPSILKGVSEALADDLMRMLDTWQIIVPPGETRPRLEVLTVGSEDFMQEGHPC